MKKTYLKPADTVIRLNTEIMIASSITNIDGVEGLSVNSEGTDGNVTTAGSRETISTPDAWDEW